MTDAKNLIRLPPTTTMTAEQALQSALVDAEANHRGASA